jgi:hypothetical protein
MGDGTLNIKTLNCVRENTDFNVVSPPGINCTCKKDSNGLYLYGGKNCEINPNVYCNRNAKYFNSGGINTDNPSCFCSNNTSSESRCTRYNLINTAKISFSDANRIWSPWHTDSETFNMVIYVYPGINSSISVTNGNLKDTRTTYFSPYEKYTLYFIDQSAFYGPDVTLTIWNDTNPDVKYSYNIQQNFWSAFYPRPDLNIKSGDYSQTWSWTDSNDPTLSNNPSIFNGAGRSYKPECSNNRVYACFAAQIYVSMPIK